MRPVRRGVYRCTICDDTVFARADALPAASFVDSRDGMTTERVITVAGVEVHRCIYITAGGQRNGTQALGPSGLMLFEHRRTLVEPTTDPDCSEQSATRTPNSASSARTFTTDRER